MSKFAALGRKVDFTKPRRMNILDPITGQPMKSADGKELAYIDFFSDDSPQAKAFDREQLDLRITRKTRPTAEDIENESLLKLARQSAGWKLFDPEGEVLDVEHSEQNAVELFKVQGFILEQGLEFVRNRGNFKTV